MGEGFRTCALECGVVLELLAWVGGGAIVRGGGLLPMGKASGVALLCDTGGGEPRAAGDLARGRRLTGRNSRRRRREDALGDLESGTRRLDELGKVLVRLHRRPESGSMSLGMTTHFIVGGASGRKCS